MKRLCYICGTPLDNQTAIIKSNICNNPQCQKQAEYLFLLEPSESISIKCPYCQKNIAIVTHKEKR